MLQLELDLYAPQYMSGLICSTVEDKKIQAPPEKKKKKDNLSAW